MLLEHKEELAYLDGTPTGKSVDDAVKEVEFGATILKCMELFSSRYPLAQLHFNSLQIMLAGLINTLASHILPTMVSSR